MSKRLPPLSVIVPLAPLEEAWTRLAHDLGKLPPGSEVLFVGPRPPKGRTEPGTVLNGACGRIAWVRSGMGRARQLNAGARSASCELLWFLHADSRFDVDTIGRLATSVGDAPQALHYFDLAFLGDGPQMMPVNIAGAWLRSHALGMPFGDQGFCVQKSGWLAAGGFDEAALYGEDHLFVWQAARAGIPLKCTGGKLFTSARKYKDRGWLQTTARHLVLTYKQALPELLRTMRRRATQAKGQA